MKPNERQNRDGIWHMQMRWVCQELTQALNYLEANDEHDLAGEVEGVLDALRFKMSAPSAPTPEVQP
jgi:hypothetical protein